MRVEGVSYRINWEKFRTGYSFFVPCIDHVAARGSLAAVSRRLQMRTVTKVTIEGGIKGLRVWRV